jgi:hypothetical protein
MIQTRKTGSTISCLWPALSDHAGMPVMLPRDSDSDMCLEGSNAGFVPPKTAFDEHGRMHGVSDLDDCKGPLKCAWITLASTDKSGEWRWRRLAEKRPQIRMQDKGRPSWYLLSVCLHILLSRDRNSSRRDNCIGIGANLSFFCENHEQLFGRVLTLTADAHELVAGACAP